MKTTIHKITEKILKDTVFSNRVEHIASDKKAFDWEFDAYLEDEFLYIHTSEFILELEHEDLMWSEWDAIESWITPYIEEAILNFYSEILNKKIAHGKNRTYSILIDPNDNLPIITAEGRLYYKAEDILALA